MSPDPLGGQDGLVLLARVAPVLEQWLKCGLYPIQFVGGNGEVKRGRKTHPQRELGLLHFTEKLEKWRLRGR